MNEVYIGIDFSLNSPAFCLYKNKKYIWGSLTRSDRTPDSLLKNKENPFYILNEAPDFKLLFLKRKEISDNYTEKERSKIIYYLELIDLFWSEIEGLLEKNDIIYIAIEGLSFSSNGNALIDISMATALLRYKIINRISPDNFYVFPPTEIKKFAKKGNAKKYELYEELINYKQDGTNLNKLSIILENNKNKWITSKLNINKPIDDIVDATWITIYLIKKINEIKGN